MKKLGTLALLCVGLSVAQTATAQAPAASAAWVGNWRLNLSHSKFSGTAPKSEDRTIALSGDGMIVRSTVIAPSGAPMHFNYSVTLDGRFHPLIGNPDGDSISVRLLTPRKVSIAVRRNGKASATATTQVSAMRLVMERHRLKLSGSPSDDILVYDRVR